MTGLLSSIALLACPVGMGVMMLVMARGGKRRDAAGGGNGNELARLRAEQAALDDQIARIEGGQSAHRPVTEG